jgi:hypothetical protein
MYAEYGWCVHIQPVGIIEVQCVDNDTRLSDTIRLGYDNRVDLDGDLYLLGYASTLVNDSGRYVLVKLMSTISDGVTIGTWVGW